MINVASIPVFHFFIGLRLLPQYYHYFLFLSDDLPRLSLYYPDHEYDSLAALDGLSDYSWTVVIARERGLILDYNIHTSPIPVGRTNVVNSPLINHKLRVPWAEAHKCILIIRGLCPQFILATAEFKFSFFFALSAQLY